MPKPKILTSQTLANFITKQLDHYLSERSQQIWYDFINFFNSAGYNPNSFDARRNVVDYVKAAIDLAQKSGDLGQFVETLAKAIHSIEDAAEKSTLKDHLIYIMDKTAKYLFQHEHFAEAKLATKYADMYFNNKMAQDFREYAKAKISGSSLMYFFNQFKGVESFEQNKHCAQWAEYIAVRSEGWNLPTVNHSDNNADHYQNLLVEMTIILNLYSIDPKIDDKLANLILSYQIQIIERFIHPYRTPGVTLYHQCVIGFTQPERDKLRTNKSSIYCKLQNILHNTNQTDDVSNTKSNKATSDKAIRQSLLIVNPEVDTQKARQEAEQLLDAAWPKLMASENQMRAERHKRKVKIFADTLRSALAKKILASKVIDSGYLPIPQSNLGVAGNVLAAIAERAIPVPLVAQLASAGINQIARTIDHPIQVARFNNAADFVPQINQIDPLVQLIAEKVTLRFIQQIQQLYLESDATTVITAANCAVTRIFKFIQDGELKKALKGNISHENIANELAKAITYISTHHGLIPFTQRDMLQSVPSRNNHTIEESFSCPGIVVIVGNSARYYFNGHLEDPNYIYSHAGLAMIAKYGFMEGDMGEVNTRLLKPLPACCIPKDPHPAIMYRQNLTASPAKDKVALPEKNIDAAQQVVPIAMVEKSAAASSSSSELSPANKSVTDFGAAVTSQQLSHLFDMFPDVEKGDRNDEKYKRLLQFKEYRTYCLNNPPTIINSDPKLLPAKPDLMPLGYDKLKEAYEKYACSSLPEGAIQYIKVLNTCNHRFHHSFLQHYGYWVEKAANAGDPESLLYIAKCYYVHTNTHGLQQNHDKAKHYLRLALKSGDTGVVEKAQKFMKEFNINIESAATHSYQAADNARQTLFSPRNANSGETTLPVVLPSLSSSTSSSALSSTGIVIDGENVNQQRCG